MSGHKDRPFWTAFSFILVSLLAIFLLCSCTGCFTSPPVYKKAPRQPLPQESYESEERTRQAVRVMLDRFKDIDPSGGMLKIAAALSAKIGVPAYAVEMSREALDALAENLKKDTTDMRIKKKNWDRKYDKDATFVQGKQSFASKVKSNFKMMLIIFGIACIVIPGFGVKCWRWITKRIQTLGEKLSEEYKKEFDDDYDFKTRFQDQTQIAVDKFKEAFPNLWIKLEPFFKDKHDQDIQKEIKKNGK